MSIADIWGNKVKKFKVLIFTVLLILVASIYFPVRSQLIRFAIRNDSEKALQMALLLGANAESFIDGTRLPEIIVMKASRPIPLLDLLLMQGMSPNDRQLIDFSTLFGSYDVVLFLVKRGGKFFRFEEGNLFVDQRTIAYEKDEDIVIEILKESMHNGVNVCADKFFLDQAWQHIKRYPKIEKAIKLLCTKK